MKKLSLLTILSFVLVVLFALATYAAQVGSIQNLRGKAKLFPEGNPNTWVWAEVGMAVSDRAVIQVGPGSAVLLNLNGQQITLEEKSTVQVPQLLSRGANALRQGSIRTPGSSGGQVSSMAGVRASQVEGVELGGLSWITNNDSKGNLNDFITFLNQMYSNGNYNVVIQVLNLYFQQNALNADLQLILGMSQFNFGAYSDAIETLKQINSGQHAEKVAYFLGLSNLKNGNAQEAVNTLSGFEASFPQSDFIAEVQLNLGYAYKELGNAAEAKKCFEKAAQAKDANTKSLAEEALK